MYEDLETGAFALLAASTRICLSWISNALASGKNSPSECVGFFGVLVVPGNIGIRRFGIADEKLSLERRNLRTADSRKLPSRENAHFYTPNRLDEAKRRTEFTLATVDRAVRQRPENT
jgi:hypothetical protein